MKPDVASLLEEAPEEIQAQVTLDGIDLQITHTHSRLVRLSLNLLNSAVVPLLQLTLGTACAFAGIYLTILPLIFLQQQGWIPDSLGFLMLPVILFGIFGGIITGMKLPKLAVSMLMKLRKTSNLNIGQHELTLPQGGKERRISFSEILFIDGIAGTVVLRSRERVAFGQAYSKTAQKWLAALLKATCPIAKTAETTEVPAALRALQERTTR